VARGEDAGSLSQAITAVETATKLSKLPATREAFVAGKLSEVQAAEITAAAAADPTAEGELLRLAAQESVSSLRDRCREVRASVASDEDAGERIRRGRYLRHWSDRDGAFRLDARLAPDDGARLIAAVIARAGELQEEARRSGLREREEAFEADALVGLTTGDRVKATVHVHVDADAWERGHTEAGEVCAIEGGGPIAVTTARRLAAEGIVKALASDGADVRAVAHLGRTIHARVRTALEARDPMCVVPGCEVRKNLEIDHIVPLSKDGETKLENLARLCRFHHAEKTHRGWVLSGSPGEWVWTRGRAQPGRARS